MPATSRTRPYQLFMLGLSVYVLIALSLQVFLTLDVETIRVLEVCDFAICLLFLVDFLRSLWIAEDRTRYLVTWGWVDLISSIPTVDVFRWGRAARVFRILRVFRGLRATRILSAFALERRAESAFWGVLLVSILATVFASVAILHLEVAPDSNIGDAEDAIWWAFVTITTVGYGDLFPVTPSGRVLASLLMALGIGLFGTLTAYFASMFMTPEEDQQEQQLAAVLEELRLLREALAAGPRAAGRG